MRSKVQFIFLFVSVLSVANAVRAQQTSRLIHFTGVSTTIAPSTSGQALTFQLWDAVTAGNQLYCENQTLDVDANSAISFDFGAGSVPSSPCLSLPPGLNPADFQSGSSRYLDVADANGQSVLTARLPITAVAFALSPGPAGPTGPKGDKGDKGDSGQPGVVQTITAADSSIAVGGPATDRTVAVADGGITAAKLAANAVTAPNIAVPLQISGTSANSIVASSNSGSGPGVFGMSANGWGVRGDSTTDNGVQGLASAAGKSGVAGRNDNATGTGVSGFSLNGDGVAGFANAAGKAGVVGRNDDVNGFGGVFGLSANGWGVRGDSTTNNGIQGLASAPGKSGVAGRNDNATGNGVSGFSLNGDGVAGFASAAGKAGVVGRNDNVNGFGGVFGLSANGWGVRGDSTTNNGVQGLAFAPGTSGVSGRNDNAAGIGVSGVSTDGIGVLGGSNGGSGVRGTSPTGLGVFGGSDSGTGVNGTSHSGTGVRGESNTGFGLFGTSSKRGIVGEATDTTGTTYGVTGTSAGPDPGSSGVFGSHSAGGFGVFGSSSGSGVVGINNSGGFFPAGISAGVVGSAGSNAGVWGQSLSATGGIFVTDTGNILIGKGDITFTRFRVDKTGKVFANGGFQGSGADFAESVEPSGTKSAYQPGDVLVIDPSRRRAVGLSAKPYSTRVAGIYSTKPGMLASTYEMDDPRLAREIPLAIVGIVPCNVSAENGPIKAGDLLVTSSTPGHAMKGTNRSRMLGAVVGKALEPLPSSKGVIQVLVTLQ